VAAPATDGPRWLNGEAIMTNSNDTSRLATFEDHDTLELEDTELDAVNGGLVVIRVPNIRVPTVSISYR